MDCPVVFSNDFFKTELVINSKTTRIRLKVKSQIFYTKSLPLTHQILKKTLPQIFSHLCFNQTRAAFSKEAKNTEIGHLFEHIFLEYLRRSRKKAPYPAITFRGLTFWDWAKEEVGTFHIKIWSRVEFTDILPQAIDQSIELLKQIYEAHLVLPNRIVAEQADLAVLSAAY